MAQKTKAKKKTKKKVNKKLSKKARKIRYTMLWLTILAIIIGVIVLVLMSDLFNISKITVINTKILTEEQVVQASTLQTNQNRFKKSKLIVIDIEEREATYMIKQEEKYAYIDNQGYILEISTIPINGPIITGVVSQNITPGNRLEVKDLKKLDTLIEIRESAKAQNIAELITEVDISDDRNFILSIPSHKKTVEFGNGSDINIKILKLIEVLKKTEGQEGTIFMKNRVYFSEKV